MKHSLTNRALGVGGDSNTTSVTVRLPSDVVAYIDSHLNGRIKNRSEFLQHWAQVGVRVSMSEELTEALDWALDRPVQQVTLSLDDYGPVTITTEALGGAPDAETIVVQYEPPRMNLDDRIESVETTDLSELGQIREAQLEALRSRVR